MEVEQAEAAPFSEEEEEEEEELASPPFAGEMPTLPPRTTPSLGGGAAAAVDSARCDSKRERRPVGGRARSGVAAVEGGVEGGVEANGDWGGDEGGGGGGGGAPSLSSSPSLRPSPSSSSPPSFSWEAGERSADDAEEAAARTRSWRRGRGRRRTTLAAAAEEATEAATGVATPLDNADDDAARLLVAAIPLLAQPSSAWHREDLICTARIESDLEDECKRVLAARKGFANTTTKRKEQKRRRLFLSIAKTDEHCCVDFSRSLFLVARDAICSCGRACAAI